MQTFSHYQFSLLLPQANLGPEFGSTFSPSLALSQAKGTAFGDLVESRGLWQLCPGLPASIIRLET